MSPRLVTHLRAHQWVAMRRLSPDQARPRTPVVHDHATIVFYLSGRAEFWMHGLYELGPRDLLLVPAGVPHYSVRAEGVRSLGVSLCPSCVASKAAQELVAAFDAVRRGGCACRTLGPEDAQRLEQVLRGLEAELASERQGAALAVEAFVSLLAVSISRAGEGAEAKRRGATSPLVAQALQFVQRNAVAGISLRDVAAHVGRSPAHLAALVKDTTGETVVGWISRARMSEGRQLLLHTDQTVEQVAERCGFASPSHFHRAFRRAHSMTPGAWRRAHRLG